MLPEEILKKVRMIEIVTRKRVDDLMSGQYKSHFKGTGVQFSEHRLYVAGDDVRHIDWKVSARSRDPLIKKYEEERELTVLLVVDVSGSKQFGTSQKLKSEVAAELGGMLAYAAIHSGDKVGVILFSDRIEKIIPPKKGKSHVLRIIRDLLTFEAKHAGTNLGQALDSAGRVLRHSGVIFVLSDFLSKGYDSQLKRLARRHDVVAVNIGDLREKEVPGDLGRILVVDPETGAEQWIDTHGYAFRKWMEGFRKKFEESKESAFKNSQVEELKILTKDDYADAVVRFFRARSKKRGR